VKVVEKLIGGAMGALSAFWTPAWARLVLMKVLLADTDELLVARATSSARLPAFSGVRGEGFVASVDIDPMTRLIVFSLITAGGLA
jgi:hypothetical protein